MSRQKTVDVNGLLCRISNGKTLKADFRVTYTEDDYGGKYLAIGNRRYDVQITVPIDWIGE